MIDEPKPLDDNHKPLFCVSDLHMGDSGPQDCFDVKTREARFMSNESDG
jgi:hypothetical protein